MSQPPVIRSATLFEKFLEEEVEKVRGVSYPVKPLLLTRLLVRKAPLSKLHPNPDDEFCDPAIGPNYKIISQYEKMFREYGPGNTSVSYSQKSAGEPLEVLKIRPDGYQILNGHHRWAAAWRTGIRRMNIHILNLTTKSDIENMLKASRNDRRVTLDLDETVFCALPGEENGFEKPLPSLFRKACSQQIRRGIPALLHYLALHGYDIWVYTSQYLSLEHLRFLFIYYHCPVTGLVTGTARKFPAGFDLRKSIESMVKKRYRSTVHIDNDMLLKTFTDSKEFREVPISRSSGPWAQAVIDAFEKLDAKS